MKTFWKRRAAKAVQQDEYRLHRSAMKEDPSQLKELLVGHGWDVDEVEKGMLHTPLMLAVEMERTESIELLLDHGADPNLQNIEGRTALHLLPERQPITWTRIENKVRIAELLLRHGADLAISDRYGGQPLWYAVFHVKEPEDVQLVEMYLNHGADPRYKNEKNGQSPLDFAKKVAYRPLVESLERHLG
ncbi:hypothetical protein EGT67_22950 [Prescottella agglutinans]|uniref:Ankyrin repeat domain-containing protein n=1 Tax=Prescottella agglutinans TaxID=1644129 RepID=A0A3S3AS20_9NOCA|nr:ankyrin repeat domain-containing protein [Prescottella agglutinans]RVW07100.1 hypothetical protein EGT67_22950 [Prescottella agglutinans]